MVGVVRRRRSWGPVDKAVAGLLCLLLLAGGVVLTVWLLPEKCGEGLEAVGPAEECIGVTDEAVFFDEELEPLIEDVAAENTRVEQGGIPYVKVALMMPFTTDPTSAMTMDLIKHALAGAHLAQLRANADSGPRFQLLLANDGKDLNHWEPVVEQLAGMTDDESPLVAVIGYPSSTPATQRAADALSKESIPSIGPVIFSTDMSSDYLFKNSASNEHLVLALEQHLEKHPGAGSGEGFLVWDAREQDNYAINLREEFQRRFGDAYGLRQRNSSYLGTIGDDVGIPKLFGPIAQKICLTEVDTVFYAGRDRDLPGLISQLAGQANCDHDQEIRIMKVGVGLDPVLTTPETTEDLREARITLVGAADVHPRWWQEGERRPSGFQDFHDLFEKRGPEWDLGAKPLDDGYTIMYHDAFRAASEAFEGSYFAANEGGGGDQPVIPAKHDVYNALTNMNVLGTEEGSDCVDCVRGASGTFGFDTDPSTDKWAVCKRVPIILYPPGSGDGGKRDEAGDDALYRTHQDVFDGQCI